MFLWASCGCGCIEKKSKDSNKLKQSKQEAILQIQRGQRILHPIKLFILYVKVKVAQQPSNWNDWDDIG